METLALILFLAVFGPLVWFVAGYHRADFKRTGRLILEGYHAKWAAADYMRFMEAARGIDPKDMKVERVDDDYSRVTIGDREFYVMNVTINSLLAEVDVRGKVSGWPHLHQIPSALSRKPAARQRP